MKAEKQTSRFIQSSILYWIRHPPKKKRIRSRTPRSGPPLFSWARVQAIMRGEIKDEMPEDFIGKGFPAGEPTGAIPGTREKIQVMRERASRCQQLNHPRDATMASRPAIVIYEEEPEEMLCWEEDE